MLQDTSRRKFLIQSGTVLSSAFLGATLLPGVKLYAQAISASAPDHFFVMLNTAGAMDCTLGLDPQIMPPGLDEQDIFIEYRPENIVSMGKNIRLGPAAATALKPYATDIAVLNGILMSTNNNDHTVLNLYMRSGNGKGKVPTFPVELAATNGSGPFGVILNSGSDIGNRDVLPTTVQDIQNAANGSSAVNDTLARLWNNESADQKNSYIGAAQKAFIAGSPFIPQIAGALKQYSNANPTSGGGQQPAQETTSAQTVSAAFSTGAARQAEIFLSPSNAGNGLDTHSDHPKNHLQVQTSYWESVARVFDVFKKTPFKSGSLFDATTFMVATEFSRTPFLNPARGKDHNPLTNSILLAGKDIQGGQTFGASRAYSRHTSPDGQGNHIAAPFDFKTGEIATSRAGAAYIRPENVIRTLLASFGDPKGFEIDYSTAPISKLLKA